VKKGDDVKKGDVMVLLEDDEYRARVMQSEGVSPWPRRT